MSQKINPLIFVTVLAVMTILALSIKYPGSSGHAGQAAKIVGGNDRTCLTPESGTTTLRSEDINGVDDEGLPAIVICSGDHSLDGFIIGDDGLNVYCQDNTNLHGDPDYSMFEAWDPPVDGFTSGKIHNCNIDTVSAGFNGEGGFEIYDNVISARDYGVDALGFYDYYENRAYPLNVHDNDITVPMPSGSSHTGISFSMGYVKANTIHGGDYGINIGASPEEIESKAIGNTIEGAEIGIFITALKDFEDNMYHIRSNILSHVDQGIVVQYGSMHSGQTPADFTILKNTISADTYGIHIDGRGYGYRAPESRIYGNVIIGGVKGIFLENGANGVTIENNELSGASEYEIYCSDSGTAEWSVEWSCNDCNGGSAYSSGCTAAAECKKCSQSGGSGSPILAKLDSDLYQ
ncbi:MAG: NosD domain-containing protein [Nanoarchaeota archaeon]